MNLGRVKVIHGAADGIFENIVGVTVAALQAALVDAFNVPADALAFINGTQVSGDHRLQPNEVLEFVKANGFKGLGELLTPEELKARLKITEEQYQELLENDLPTIKFRDGAIRHPEIAVDDWWKSITGTIGNEAPPSPTKNNWFFPASSSPPASHSFGPLEGSQKHLASWLSRDGKADPRRLHNKAMNGIVWVRKLNARSYEAWFRSEQEFRSAERRRAERASEIS